MLRDTLGDAANIRAPAPAERPLVLRAIVAVPVRDEAERIGACLAALDAQTGVAAGSFGAVLLLNNCVDDTEAHVAALAPTLSFPLRAIVRQGVAEASAGWARREAMAAAADWLDAAGARDAVLLTTDADTRVGPDWIARNLAAIDAGADAVAGCLALDPAEAARLPERLHARGRLEAAYGALLAEIAALIDPDPRDPWPRHDTASGATLAVRLNAYRAVGGVPPLALGEDRALVDALVARDLAVRHDPDILVVTSGRLNGRAPGGTADTMRRRAEDPDAPCDDRLEALPRALWRAFWHRRLRRLHGAGRLAAMGRWAPWLATPRDAAVRIAALPHAGAVLQAVESVSPRLAPRPLTPRELPREIARARLVLAGLRRLKLDRAAARRAGTLASAPGPAAG